MIRRDIIIIPQKLCFPPVSAHMPLEWVMKHQRPNSVSAFKCMFILPFGRLGSGNDLTLERASLSAASGQQETYAGRCAALCRVLCWSVVQQALAP